MFTSKSKKTTGSETLPARLVERVLAKLGFSNRPEPNLAGLQAIYHAWCRKVPFDNTLWRIYLASGSEKKLPGQTPADFFESWLAYGTGGICFPSATAMNSLLISLGFDVCPVLSWMPDAMHATIIADCDGTAYLVDQSVPHSELIALDEVTRQGVVSPGWGMKVFFEGGRWHYRWRAFRLPGVEEIGCVWEPRHYLAPNIAETLAENGAIYQRCREWSKYNYNLNATLFRGDVLMRVVEGKREVIIDRAGGVIQRALNADERMDVMVNAFGIAEEIVRRLPPDVPTVDRRQAVGERRQQTEDRAKAKAERRQGRSDRRRDSI